MDTRTATVAVAETASTAVFNKLENRMDSRLSLASEFEIIPQL